MHQEEPVSSDPTVPASDLYRLVPIRGAQFADRRGQVVVHGAWGQRRAGGYLFRRCTGCCEFQDIGLPWCQRAVTRRDRIGG